MFLTLFLLFLRFLPAFAISELKAVLPQASPHHGGAHEPEMGGMQGPGSGHGSGVGAGGH